MNRDRAKAAIAVAIFHVLLGYAFITGLGTTVVKRLSDDLKVFDVTPPPPPSPEAPIPPKQPSKEREGAAAAPNIKSRATPVVAPPPVIRLKVPPPVTAAPLPVPVHGSDASAGASDVAGPETGAGGQGTGLGSGGQGEGTGGGRAAVRAQFVRGQLRNQDYPRSAMRAGEQGSVSVRFTVGTDGRVRGCRILRSSGSPALDDTTCELIEERFRYRPALDSSGDPVEETIAKTYDWILPYRGEPPR